jgi:hypothetical protein
MGGAVRLPRVPGGWIPKMFAATREDDVSRTLQVPCNRA